MIDGQTIDEVPSITANGLQGCLRKLNHMDWPLTLSVIIDESEASPPSRAGLPGKEDCHFCIAPLDPALPDGACGEQAGQVSERVVQWTCFHKGRSH